MITEAKFIKESLDRIVPVNISYGEKNRFLIVGSSEIDVSRSMGNALYRG